MIHKNLEGVGKSDHHSEATQHDPGAGDGS